jgi:hypothetical protein
MNPVLRTEVSLAKVLDDMRMELVEMAMEWSQVRGGVANFSDAFFEFFVLQRTPKQEWYTEPSVAGPSGTRKT